MKTLRCALALVGLLAVAAGSAADDKEVAKLLKQLKDKKEDKRIEASQRLVDMKVESAVPALIEALKDTSSVVRYNAAGALVNLDEKARPAVPALIEALRDPDTEVRIQAAGALRNLDEAAAEWMPVVRPRPQGPEPRGAAGGQGTDRAGRGKRSSACRFGGAGPGRRRPARGWE